MVRSGLVASIFFVVVLGALLFLSRLPAAEAVDAAPRVVNVASPQEGVVVKMCVAEGDVLTPGVVVAQLDDQLAAADLEIKKVRCKMLEVKKESLVPIYDRFSKVFSHQKQSITEEELRTLVLTHERNVAEAVALGEAIHVAQLELKRAELVVEMHQVTCPTGGVVKAVRKRPGEAVKNLETVIQLQRTDP